MGGAILAGAYAVPAIIEWLAGTSPQVAAGLSGTATTVLAKLPRPDFPRIFNNVAEFGRAIQWGTGSDAARAQIPNLSREAINKIGLTYEMAAQWAEFYTNEMIRNPSNPSAAGRADLMKAIMELLK